MKASVAEVRSMEAQVQTASDVAALKAQLDRLEAMLKAVLDPKAPPKSVAKAAEK